MAPKCVAFLFVHFGVSSIDSQRPQTKEQATAAQWVQIYFEVAFELKIKDTIKKGIFF